MSSSKILFISASCAATSALAVTHQNVAGKFLSAQEPVHMAVSGSRTRDASWDGKKVQNEDVYSSDYVKDEAPAPYNSTNDTAHVFKDEKWPKRGFYTNQPKAENYGEARRWAGQAEFHAGAGGDDDSSEGDLTSSVGFGHSPQWYVDRCEEITEACAAAQDAVTEEYERDLSDLEAEYRRQLRILEGKEDDHADEVADVKAQRRAVKKQKMKVNEAKEVVKESAHCPPELQEAKQKLYELEAVPNKTPEDIEEECKWRKVVMEKEKCVETFLAAQDVLREEEAEHGDEKNELHGEKADEADAAAALPPQEKRVADAKAAWEAAKAKGPKTVTTGGSGDSCQADKDALLAALLADIKALEDEYLRQKRILAGKEDTHADEKADVAAQEEDVANTRERVKKAKAAVKRNEHCPPELEEAKQHLADLEAVPNETPEDIEEECKAKKVVLEKEQCVEVLREAESVLRENKIDHKGEKSQLKSEEYDEEVAADALPPQEKRVADAKAALDAARAALDALKNCVNGGKSSESDEAEPAPAPEARSGAARQAASAIVLVAVSFLASFS